MTTPIESLCDRSHHASRSSGTRKPGVVRWIVLHDEEAPTALSAALWFADTREPDRGGPQGSAHLCVDDDRCFRTLDNDEIPWAAASSFGVNTLGFHIEMAGYAAWSSVVWTNHVRTLRRAAYKTALHCLVFDIEPEFVFAANLPRLGGITTHAEVTKASKRLDPQHAWKYTHTDPGRFWPRRLFMRLAREYYADLNS